MKKYIKPTAEVVELSVKESLSALPAGVTRGAFTKTQIVAATPYTILVSQVKATQQTPLDQ